MKHSPPMPSASAPTDANALFPAHWFTPSRFATAPTGHAAFATLSAGDLTAFRFPAENTASGRGA